MTAKNYVLGLLADTLAEFSDQVRDEEVGASQFVDAVPAIEDGEPLTRVEFLPLSTGQVPEGDPVFVQLADLPAGSTAAWTGVVAVAGRNTAVHMFRREAA